MSSLITLIILLLLLWGVWGLVKFIFSNFSAIFWTSVAFFIFFGFYLTSTGQ